MSFESLDEGDEFHYQNCRNLKELLPSQGSKAQLGTPPSFKHNLKLSCVTSKQTLRYLSLSYQKKDGRAWPRPSFFWYDTDF